MNHQFTLLLFGILRERAHNDSLTIDSAQNEMSVNELLEITAREHSWLRDWLPHIRVAIDCEYVDNEARVNCAQEIALLPPVAGG